MGVKEMLVTGALRLYIILIVSGASLRLLSTVQSRLEIIILY